MILYRPVGFEELELIAKTNYTAFPARLPDQPIFYPVLNFQYAREIAEGWNTKYNVIPCGFVTKFAVEDSYIKKFKVETVGARIHKEFWIPAEELDEFNSHIVGKISVEAAYYAETFEKDIDLKSNLPIEIMRLANG